MSVTINNYLITESKISIIILMQMETSPTGEIMKDTRYKKNRGKYQNKK